MRITFKSRDAWTVFCAMAEGMSEVQEDNGNKTGVLLLDTLVEMIGWHMLPGTVYPASLELDDVPGEAAQVVLDNCEDLASGAAADDPDVLHPGDVTIDP